MNKRIAKKILKRCKWPYNPYEYISHSPKDTVLLFKAIKRLHLKWTPLDEVTILLNKDYWEI